MDDNEKMYNTNTCTRDETCFPLGIRQTMKKTNVLYYKGNIAIINQNRNVAVIGSRKCSEEGLRLSYETGRLLADSGINLVNGLAIGCDTEALRGALSMGGKCVAVMPCGLDQIQPKSNRTLAETILRNGGCLLSQYPDGTGIQKYQYVERDRLQSAISQGVLVIEAEVGSGTMHTVEFAKKQAKRLACYYYKMFQNASGNKHIESMNNTTVLYDEKDTRKFLSTISKEEQYQQLSLF